MEEPMLPKFEYYLDESDPDVVLLPRQDGAFVGVFSARGVTKEGITQATEEDYRARIRAQADSLGLPEGEDREKRLSPTATSENTSDELHELGKPPSGSWWCPSR